MHSKSAESLLLNQASQAHFPSDQLLLFHETSLRHSSFVSTDPTAICVETTKGCCIGECMYAL